MAGGLDRLALFIDYQNAYMGARHALSIEPGSSHIAGQFDPLRLAWLMAGRHPNYDGANPRQLVQVSIYRGLPNSSVDPVGYGAVRRQVSRWRSSGADGGHRLPRKPFIGWEHRLTQLDYRDVHDPTDYRPSMSPRGR
jgi:hypothetical protein